MQTVRSQTAESSAYWDDYHPAKPLVRSSARRRVYEATLAMTRSRAKANAGVLRSGVVNMGLPGASAVLAAEEEMLCETSEAPDPMPPDMDANSANFL